MAFLEIVEAVIEDGMVTADEVVALRTEMENGAGRGVAEALFQINDATCPGGNNDPSFTGLFVDYVSSYFMDVFSGEVDDAENEGHVEWLKDQIIGDGDLDDNGRVLLKKLKEKITGDTLPALQALFDTVV